MQVYPQNFPANGTVFEIKENTIKCGTSSSTFIKASKELSLPSPLPIPKVIINTRNFSECSRIYLDASSSIFGTAPLRFNWTLISATSTNTSIFKELLRNSSSHSIIVPVSSQAHLQIQPGTHLTIRLTITNVLNLTNYEEVQIFKNPGNPPVISLDLPPFVKLISAVSNALNAEAFAYSCDGSRIPTPIFWRFFSQNGSEIHVSSILESLLKQPTLFLPPHTFRNHLNKNVTVVASTSGTSNNETISESSILFISASPISVRLFGAYTIIRSSQNHTLTAIIIDLDNSESNAAFNWMFYDSQNTNQISSKSDIANSQSTFTIDPTKTNVEHAQISVNVTKDGRTAQASGWIRMVDSSPIPVSISSSSNTRFVDVRKAVSLFAGSSECSTSNECAFSWILFDVSMESRQFVLESGTIRSQRLTINPGFLKLDSRYLVCVNVTKDSRWGYAEFEMKTAANPFGGRLEITPETGRALSTSFQIRTFGWITEEDLMPLKFEFSYQQPNRNAATFSNSGVASFETLFPGGDVCIRVDVSNQAGGTTSIQKCVEIQEIEQSEAIMRITDISNNLFNQSNGALNDVNGVLTKSKVMLGALDSIASSGNPNFNETQMENIATQIITQSISLFSSTPVTETSVSAATSIIAAGSRLLESANSSASVYQQLSNTSSLIIASLENIDSSPTVFAEIVSNVYQTLDMLISSQAISKKHSKSALDETNQIQFPTSNIAHIQDLQSVQSRKRVCGEQDYELVVKSASLRITSGGLFGSNQVASVANVTMSRQNNLNSEECTEFGINILSNKTALHSALIQANIKLSSDIVLANMFDQKIARRKGNAEFNITLPLNHEIAHNESTVCASIDSKAGLLDSSNCETLSTTTYTITCKCLKGGIVFASPKGTDFSTAQNDENEQSEKQSGSNSIVLPVSVVAAVLVVAVITTIIYRRRIANKKLMRIIVSEADSQSSADVGVPHVSRPIFLDKREQPATIQISQDLDVDDLEDNLDEIPVV